ncbi:MAG: SDR family oxidoreductase [Deltaproteobacteria bacterium]|nr:SDR family oxidoreductase [Deltaproteobacteria bacterium]
MPDDLVLLTGATGFLGRELAVRLAERGRLALLVRRRESELVEDLERRIKTTVFGDPNFQSRHELKIFVGDVTTSSVGLSRADRSFLLGSSTQIIHGAAQIRFDLPLAEMERQNVGGTKHILELADELHQRGALRRLDYVSTAYVAGDRTGTVYEHELDVGQSPRNAYEQSKLEAEKILRVASKRLPVVVHRPSIIVGDSQTGRASSFKVLYWPMKIYVRGRFSTIFGRPLCPVDVVPVDYVADAITALVDEPAAIGKTLHLAAGFEGQATVGELVDLAERLLDGPPVDYVDPEIYLRYLRPIVRPLVRLLRPDVAEGAVFLPYLSNNPSFDTSVARGLLAPRGVRARSVLEYFDVIVRYAIETDFGRKAAETKPARDS